MSVTIPDGVLESARMSESELLQEIAVLLFKKEKLTLAQACTLSLDQTSLLNRKRCECNENTNHGNPFGGVTLQVPVVPFTQYSFG